MTRKILAASDPGDSGHFGADDIDYINSYLSGGIQATDPVTIATATTFVNDQLQVWNAAKTFSYDFNSSAIIADRNVILPLLTADDTFVFAAFIQSLTNKTFTLATNTLTDTGIALGDLIKYVSGKYQRYAIGTTGQVLTVSAGDASWQNLPAQTPLPNVLTVGASGAQYTTLQAAVNAITTNPTVIQIAPGTYSTSSAQLITLTKSNVSIEGSGEGVTIIQADASVTGDTPILDIHGAASGASLVITVNTNPGDLTVTISPTDATTLNSAGAQYVLVRSNKIADTEFGAGWYVGEIQRVSAINTTTGVITLKDELNDSYLTTDSASLIQIIPVNNVSVSGITFTSVAATSARTGGFISCRFLNDFAFSACEVDKAWWGGIELSSCINSRLETCYMHDTQDPSGGGGSTHYGAVIKAASKNIVVDTCQFSNTRHSVTMGASSGTNFQGIVRNVTITNCTSENCDTAHFDCHQACENIVFSSNTAVGGTPAGTMVNGFQVRSPKTSLIGNKIIRCKGRGIYIYAQGSGTNISGCTVTNGLLNSGGAGGDGVYLESTVNSQPAITNVNITGCTFSDCVGHAVTGGTGNNDININGNSIKNCCTTSLDGNIKLDGTGVVVTGNRFTSPAGANRPIQMIGSADKWTIVGNDFTGMTTPAPLILGTGSTITHNTGYNPIGVITTAFPAGTGDLTNVSQTNNAPNGTSPGAVITVRLTPKSIQWTPGTGTGIGTVNINGIPTGSTASTYYKLDVGETFQMPYTTAPTFTVKGL